MGFVAGVIIVFNLVFGFIKNILSFISWLIGAVKTGWVWIDNTAKFLVKVVDGIIWFVELLRSWVEKALTWLKHYLGPWVGSIANKISWPELMRVFVSAISVGGGAYGILINIVTNADKFVLDNNFFVTFGNEWHTVSAVLLGLSTGVFDYIRRKYIHGK